MVQIKFCSGAFLCCAVLFSHIWLFETPWDSSPPGFSAPGYFPGKNLELVAMPFSRGSSRPRDWTQVSLIAGRFFTIWAMREDPRILEWAVCLFSRGPSWPRNWTMHCRWILYQLSYKGSPYSYITNICNISITPQFPHVPLKSVSLHLQPLATTDKVSVPMVFPFWYIIHMKSYHL